MQSKNTSRPPAAFLLAAALSFAALSWAQPVLSLIHISEPTRPY